MHQKFGRSLTVDSIIELDYILLAFCLCKVTILYYVGMQIQSSYICIMYACDLTQQKCDALIDAALLPVNARQTVELVAQV